MAKANTTAAGLGNEWMLLTKEARRVYEPTCHLCRKVIDLTLDANDKMAWTLDHLDARAVYGNAVPPLERTRPAHRTCNSRRGKGDMPFARRWSL